MKNKDSNEFWLPGKLLSMKDLDGLTPEIFMIAGNRTAGKTYGLKKMLIKNFIKRGRKFACLVRFSYEIEGYADSFFKDLKEIDFPDYELKQISVGKNLYAKLLLNNEHCGYVVALNTADTIKKNSANFVDVSAMFMDEFQSEISKYCPDEINKFQSVHTSIARGGGKHVRYVPVYMASNSVSVLNPYFAAFKIASRLNTDTKLLRGKGWVLEITYNKNAAKEMVDSGFGRAFDDSTYMKYAANNSFLLDNNNFICKMRGDCCSYALIQSEGQYFGIWYYEKEGLLYISRKYDPNESRRVTFRTSDHNVDYVMLDRSNDLLKRLRKLFEKGAIRFADIECKNLFLDMVGYSII